MRLGWRLVVKLLPRIQENGGTVIHSSLDAEAEELRRAAMGENPPAHCLLDVRLPAEGAAQRARFKTARCYRQGSVVLVAPRPRCAADGAVVWFSA